MTSNTTETSTDTGSGTGTSASKSSSRGSVSDEIPAEAMVRKIVRTTVRSTLTSPQPLGVRIKLDFSKGQSTLPAPNNFRMPKIQIKATKPQPVDDQGRYRSCAGADRLPRFIVSPLQGSRTPQSPQLSVTTQSSQQDVRPSTPQRAQHTHVERRQLPSAIPLAVRLWRTVRFKPVDADSSDAVAPKQNVGLLKNEDVNKWAPAAEQSVQGDNESEPAPALPPEPEVPEAQVQMMADNANSPMTVRRTEEDPGIRERAPEHTPESKNEDDEKTLTNVSPIKTVVVSSDENSFVDKNGPWGSVSEERVHLDGCINKRIQCGGKLRHLYANQFTAR